MGPIAAPAPRAYRIATGKIVGPMGARGYAGRRPKGCYAPNRRHLPLFRPIRTITHLTFHIRSRQRYRLQRWELGLCRGTLSSRIEAPPNTPYRSLFHPADSDSSRHSVFSTRARRRTVLWELVGSLPDCPRSSVVRKWSTAMVPPLQLDCNQTTRFVWTESDSSLIPPMRSPLKLPWDCHRIPTTLRLRPSSSSSRSKIRRSPLRDRSASAYVSRTGWSLLMVWMRTAGRLRLYRRMEFVAFGAFRRFRIRLATPSTSFTAHIPILRMGIPSTSSCPILFGMAPAS